jgi:hypothetical protein
MAAKVLIPFGNQKALLLKNDSLNPGQFNLRKAVISGQGNRRQPELAGRTAFIDMNMRRLRGFVAVKIKLKALFPQNRWHRHTLRLHQAQARNLPYKSRTVGRFWRCLPSAGGVCHPPFLTVRFNDA